MGWLAADGYPSKVRDDETIWAGRRAVVAVVFAFALASCGSSLVESVTENRQRAEMHGQQSSPRSPSISALTVSNDLPPGTLHGDASRPVIAEPASTEPVIVTPDHEVNSSPVAAAASWSTGIVVATPVPTFSVPSVAWPIDRVVFLGDSLTSDARSVAGGRSNDIVPLIEQHVHEIAVLSGVKVINRSVPGLATLYAIDPDANPERSTLAGQLPHALRGGRDASTLLVIPVSGSDLGASEGRRPDVVIDEVIAELERVYDGLVADGVQVVFVPAFGVNDAMYDDIRNGLAADRPKHHLNERVEQLNRGLLRSSLPVLVAGFDGLGSHDPGGAKSEYFAAYDHRPDPWPDDGIHPNREGERLFASVVGPALVELLTDALLIDANDRFSTTYPTVEADQSKAV